MLCKPPTIDSHKFKSALGVFSDFCPFASTREGGFSSMIDHVPRKRLKDCLVGVRISIPPVLFSLSQTKVKVNVDIHASYGICLLGIVVSVLA